VSAAARVLLLAAPLVLLAAPARAQDEPSLGGGLTFTGAPTLKELQAQQKACEARKPPRKAKGTISESTYKRLERIIDAIGKGQFDESEVKLRELMEASRGDYEKAIILQTLGFVYGSNNKEMLAVKAFEDALATGSLPQQVHEQMMFNIAQLYAADDKFDKSAQALNAYLQESCNPLPDAHILLATVSAEKKQWREALKQVDLALVKGGVLKESWLQLKLALHYELKEFPRCAEVLVALVAANPIKEDYWKQLSGMLFEIKKDPEALAVLALAERKGWVDSEGEIRNLSNMYMYMQVPMKAAQLLERGIDQKQMEATERNLESLGNAWLMAREYGKAEKAMARAAAASDKGELFKRLGQIQIENEQWKAALDSLQKAQRKGGLKDPGETAFLVGVCAVQLKQYKTAEQALRTAMQYEKTAQMAAQWLNHLQDEIAYNQALGDGNGESKTN